MEESLRSWLRSACIRFCNVSSECFDLEVASDSDRVRVLGSYLFSLPDECTLVEIRHELKNQLGDDTLHLDNVMATAEACLVFAVSPKSNDRKAFVQQIMELGQIEQSHLMQAIQDNLTKFKQIRVNSLTVSQMSFKQDSSDNGMCLNCVQASQEVEKYNSLVKEISSRYEESEAQLKMEIAIQTQCLAKAELQLIDKDNELIEKDKELVRMKSELVRVHSNVEAFTLSNQEIMSLKDQIDVLRPKAERMEAAETQLEKLRERFDALAGLKAQLRDETHLHSETHRKLLEAEQEVETLRKCRMQLDEYRTQYAEATITIQDLSLQLQQKIDECKKLESNQLHLVGGQHQHALQAQRLAEELNQTREQLRDVQHGAGISDGISELNPTIVLELNRLRSENKDLAGKVSASSLESLNRLERQLTDQKCISESLQIKWNDCKRVISEANIRITHLSESLASSQKEFASLQESMRETALMAEADSDSRSIHYSHQIAVLQRRHQHHLILSSIGHITVANDLLRLLQTESTNLSNSRLEVTDLTSQNSELMSQLNDNKLEIISLIAEKNKLISDHGTRVSDLLASHSLAVDELRTQLACQLQQERARCEGVVQDKCIQLSAASSELEDERMKRRRVEREKKYQEAEAVRLKAQCQQLQASGAGGGPSVQMLDEAQKEIRVMQEQLDETQKEAQSLRSRCSQLEHALNQDRSLRTAASPSPPPDNAPPPAGRTTGATRLRVGDRAPPLQSRFSGYLEQAELVDRRVEQLSREKRELLAKNLEENKERMELAQKLLQSERETATLKAKTTKLMLELERMERKVLIADEKARDACLAKSVQSAVETVASDENVENASQPPPKIRRRLYGEM